MEQKKEFNMEEAFAMWKQEGKNGAYFTGKADNQKLIGFYNTKKKNPNEPDIRIYPVDAEGKRAKEEICSLWANTSKNGKQYLSGKYAGAKVTGFITKDTKGGKRPYFRVYFRPAEEQPQLLPGEEVVSDEKVELPF